MMIPPLFWQTQNPPQQIECNLSFYEGDCGVLSLWASKDKSVAFVKLFESLDTAANETHAMNLVDDNVAYQIRSLQPGWVTTSTTLITMTLKTALCGWPAGWFSYRGGIH